MKTEFKGTPGPWKVCGRDKLTIEGADGSDVGQVLSQADSSLIAAAPELLEALQSMVEIMDGLTEAYPALKNEVALKKAKKVLIKALEE